MWMRVFRTDGRHLDFQGVRCRLRGALTLAVLNKWPFFWFFPRCFLVVAEMFCEFFVREAWIIWDYPGRSDHSGLARMIGTPGVDPPPALAN